MGSYYARVNAPGELQEATSMTSWKTGHRYNLPGRARSNGRIGLKSLVHSLISVLLLRKAQPQKSTGANILMQHYLQP
jgi:hypothetical protein